MFILIEIFTKDNNYKKCEINVNNKNFLDVKIELSNLEHIPIKKQLWYFNNIEIDDLKTWVDGNYSVYYKNDHISLDISINNNIIKTPLISKDTEIKELKNILSIKENIYFRNIKLLDDKSIGYYNLNSNNKLFVKNDKVNIFIK